MSSLEVAGLCGKQHGNVLRDIRKMSEDLNLSLSFEEKGATGGRPLTIANLSKRETLILADEEAMAESQAPIRRRLLMKGTKGASLSSRRGYAETLLPRSVCQLSLHPIETVVKRQLEIDAIVNGVAVDVDQPIEATIV